MTDQRFLKTALKSAVQAETAGVLKRINELSKKGNLVTYLPTENQVRERNKYEFARRECALKAAVKAHRKQRGDSEWHDSVLEIAQWLLDTEEEKPSDQQDG